MHMSKSIYSHMNPNHNVVTSVLGFDFDAHVTYIDDNGEEVELCKGSTCIPYNGDEQPEIGTVVPVSYHRNFTNFNQDLLDKIRDYKSKNT